jgi:1,4-alpha-glucan branching enzyme
MVAVTFRYLTGLKSSLFENARLVGSWDDAGNQATDWSESAMTPFTAEDGCPAFQATVELDAAAISQTFGWGVMLDGPGGANLWGIATEVQDAVQADRSRHFVLGGAPSTETYYLTYARRLGARKYVATGTPTALRFAAWAPYARNVEVVFSTVSRGYIADDGTGVDPTRPVLPLVRDDDGIWTSDVVPNFDTYRGIPYMYRITNEQGATKYRTDIFSRAQFGSGDADPANPKPPPATQYDGTAATLNGSKGCSVIVGQDTVAETLTPRSARISRQQFWENEFSPAHPVPTRLEDLVIYELHLAGLAAGLTRPGNLRDAIAFLDHLVMLGVNAVELLPLCEFSGQWGWGYGDTHHSVIASYAGGLDEFKHFVRECHQRGIVVIQDVCYNHYDGDGERAESQYDSTLDEHNTYLWYEGLSANYPQPDGGYLDNGSTRYAPRYWELVVRQQFISSAALLLDECHVDGFRVDLTGAIHSANALHANGMTVGSANLFGQKLLREWTRTMSMIRPTAFLIAEDHTGWGPVTQATDAGGLGFAARWFAQFYHDAVGAGEASGGHARVLHEAGSGDDRALDFDSLAGTLYASQYNSVVYHCSHDEAGNSGSMRPASAAVQGAPLVGATRTYAEARTRVVVGLSLFSAGTPMFFMAEEVASTEPYPYDTFPAHREDIVAETSALGANMFRFYQDAIALTKLHPAARSRTIDIIHENGAGRVIAFTRTDGTQQLLVIASLSNTPYTQGYVLNSDSGRLADGEWREILNSDSAIYGGQNDGNFGAAVPAQNGRFQAIVPANGVLVFLKS